MKTGTFLREQIKRKLQVRKTNSVAWWISARKVPRNGGPLHSRPVNENAPPPFSPLLFSEHGRCGGWSRLGQVDILLWTSTLTVKATGPWLGDPNLYWHQQQPGGFFSEPVCLWRSEDSCSLIHSLGLGHGVTISPDGRTPLSCLLPLESDLLGRHFNKEFNLRISRKRRSGIGSVWTPWSD